MTVLSYSNYIEMGSSASAGEDSQASVFGSDVSSSMELFSQPVSQYMLQTSVENDQKHQDPSISCWPTGGYHNQVYMYPLGQSISLCNYFCIQLYAIS